MIPDSTIFTDEILEAEYSDETYMIDVSDEQNHRINGLITDMESVEQAIYLILNTERYECPIYSWDYGIELADLIGQPIPYVMSEIPRRVEEALTQDDRIEGVTDFEFEINKRTVEVLFTVVTNVGEFPVNLEVTI